MAEGQALSEWYLIGLFLMASVQLCHLPLRQTVSAVPTLSILEGVHCIQTMQEL